uniref:Uncharacterized protein n=1 Tax=Anguilla anguilla TaxID=7936 RepID=A0A0E9XAG5_ANGAN
MVYINSLLAVQMVTCRQYVLYFMQNILIIDSTYCNDCVFFGFFYFSTVDNLNNIIIIFCGYCFK